MLRAIHQESNDLWDRYKINIRELAMAFLAGSKDKNHPNLRPRMVSSRGAVIVVYMRSPGNAGVF